VLAGHSDGGLFAQLYASTHAAQVKGLVLIDAVHQNYYARRIAMLKTLLPPNQWHATLRALRVRQPAIIDPEQINIETSLAQTRAAVATAPPHPMPLFVLTRGHPDQSGSQPRVDAADERLWRHLQDEIAALVPNSEHATVHTSSEVTVGEGARRLLHSSRSGRLHLRSCSSSGAAASASRRALLQFAEAVAEPVAATSWDLTPAGLTGGGAAGRLRETAVHGDRGDGLPHGR